MDPKDYLDRQTLDGLNEEEPSNRALAEGIKFIIRKLWSEKELDQMIDARHRELCEQCPIRKTASVPVPVASEDDDDDGRDGGKDRRAIVLAIIKSQWFWIPVATGCAIICAKYGISLPGVGGGSEQKGKHKMNTNDAIKQVHAALVAKAKAKCAVEGNNKFALEVGGKVAEYGSSWAASFGNDGALDDDEERALNAKFNALVDAYIPKKDGVLVDKAWNGFSIFFINVFKGVKNYLNEWFGLELK